MKRILFITKLGQAYSHHHYHHKSSGLLNSAQFVVRMLVEQGVEAKLVQVVDNNDIDREVTAYRPDVVVIEALWVVPEKFKILKALHSRVQWVVRIHSEIPFLAQEGVAIKWIREYSAQSRVFVAFNSKRTLRDFERLTWLYGKFLYLPNHFPTKHHINELSRCEDDEVLRVGCFGAIRPLKNQLMQAMAAMAFAESKNMVLRFHMNTARVERGEDVLKNIRALFHHTPHELVEHKWLTHREFLELLSTMDTSMCVSFSESFCIVAADSVVVGVPLVCSSVVPWSAKLSQADPNDMDGIVQTLGRVLKHRCATNLFNLIGLKKYDKESVRVWLRFAE